MGIISYELQYYVDKYGDIAGGGTIDGIMGNYLKKIFGRNYDD